MQDKKRYGKQEKKTRRTAAEPARTWLGYLEGLRAFPWLCPDRFEGHCTTQIYPNVNVCCIWRDRLHWKPDFLPEGKHARGCHLWMLFLVYLIHPVFL